MNIDPLETAEQILAYKQSEGFVWPMTVADVQVVRNYNVTRQAAYVTLDPDGVVSTSVTYGSETAEDWRELFEALLDS